MDMTEKSKYLTFILRHRPDTIGITLDKEGYADVKTLLEHINASGKSFTLEELQKIVKTDKKGRYSFSADGKAIRANQGHTTKTVDLTFDPYEPSGMLYHGTTEAAWRKIQSSGGLSPMQRQYVHLSTDLETAERVAVRRHQPIKILLVNAEKMAKDGYAFFRSENNVILTKSVPLHYLMDYEKEYEAVSSAVREECEASLD